MANVIGVLEVLWAFDRLSKTTLLSDSEKKVIVAELAATLPHEMLAHGCKGTSAIVLQKLTPSINIDEEAVGRTADKAPAKAKEETAKAGKKLYARS